MSFKMNKDLTSQMPPQLINDAHEWIEEIHIEPTLYLSLTNGTILEKFAGKKEPVELDSSRAL